MSSRKVLGVLATLALVAAGGAVALNRPAALPGIGAASAVLPAELDLFRQTLQQTPKLLAILDIQDPLPAGAPERSCRGANGRETKGGNGCGYGFLIGLDGTTKVSLDAAPHYNQSRWLLINGVMERGSWMGNNWEPELTLAPAVQTLVGWARSGMPGPGGPPVTAGSLGLTLRYLPPAQVWPVTPPAGLFGLGTVWVSAGFDPARSLLFAFRDPENRWWYGDISLFPQPDLPADWFTHDALHPSPLDVPQVYDTGVQ